VLLGKLVASKGRFGLDQSQSRSFTLEDLNDLYSPYEGETGEIISSEEFRQYVPVNCCDIPAT
jgi:hypothetical protein